eukprot:397884-Lingulodinium_polyedra.AAC.1
MGLGGCSGGCGSDPDGLLGIRGGERLGGRSSPAAVGGGPGGGGSGFRPGGVLARGTGRVGCGGRCLCLGTLTARRRVKPLPPFEPPSMVKMRLPSSSLSRQLT